MATCKQCNSSEHVIIDAVGAYYCKACLYRWIEVGVKYDSLITVDSYKKKDIDYINDNFVKYGKQE